MTSKAGVIAFAILGVVAFLLTFLGMAFTTPKAMATRKILFGGIGGAIFVWVLIVVLLSFVRYLLMKLVGKNTNRAIQ